MDHEAVLVDKLATYYADPLGFVLFVFPWGDGALKESGGPDVWQREVLEDIGKQLKVDPDATIRVAISSGNGPGKTALMAWLVWWLMSTRPNFFGKVTANSLTQLNTTTWREIAKWHRLLVNQHWFKWTATKVYKVGYESTWFTAAVPWNKDHPEAFAGTHDTAVSMFFDEASGVHDVIWEYADGVLTTPGAMWFAFGNPTRVSGRFFECFHKFKDRWSRFRVDSRNAKKANQAQIREWIEDYGDDSDYVRIHVYGEFPRSGTNQFISPEIVEEAFRFQALDYESDPVILGCDVATGTASGKSVICVRQGRMVKRFEKYRIDTQDFASRVVEVARQEKADAVFLDGIGVGVGVYDRCKALGLDVISVNAGYAADDMDKYKNKRSEMWGRGRAWLREGGYLPKDQELFDELTKIEFGENDRQQIMLERKKDYMARLKTESPDTADAFMLTFAYPVSKSKKRLESRFIDEFVGRLAWMG